MRFAPDDQRKSGFNFDTRYAFLFGHRINICICRIVLNLYVSLVDY